MSKRILLTGVGGFIGVHFLKYYLKNTDWHIIGLDSFRHKGTYSRLNEIEIDEKRFTLLKHDLSVPIDTQLENLIMSRKIDEKGSIVDEKLDAIINLASDSAVERSVIDPAYCWRNNCELILNVLELARRLKPRVFYQISSDEVYGDCPSISEGHHEWDVISPSNPYAASKAAQEALAISYWRSYGVPVVLSNCMNCIGSMQDKEKFLPKIIWKIATNQPMDIYVDYDENGKRTIGSRRYLHCENHADVFKFLIDKPISEYSKGDNLPDRYNIVGEIELNNLEMAEAVAKIMGKNLIPNFIPSESARPGYDKRYALKPGKLDSMGWKKPVEFFEGLENIVKWTLDHPWWII
jgi:dTDP-glucose 4,6-dehydratase